MVTTVPSATHEAPWSTTYSTVRTRITAHLEGEKSSHLTSLQRLAVATYFIPDSQKTIVGQ